LREDTETQLGTIIFKGTYRIRAVLIVLIFVVASIKKAVEFDKADRKGWNQKNS